MNKFPDIPKTWEELVGLRDYITDCDAHFLRLPADQEVYYAYSKQISREELLNDIAGQFKNKKTVIVVNNFPYTKVLQKIPGVIHYCLWSKCGVLGDQEVNQIANKKFKGKRWFYMERKVNHKSIPEIWHCHIFVETNS